MAIKGFGAAVPALLAICLAGLGGCESVQRRGIDPMSVSDRFTASPVNYDTLMRIAAAARAGGDLDTAVSLYRRAAELNPQAPAPFVGAGDTLVELGQINEAIVAYDAAIKRDPRDPEALRGLARAYLLSGKPQLAAEPLAVAISVRPNDPKLLQLIGVTDDFAMRHAAAQARYRSGLELAPGDPGLSLNLALSLALTGDYAEAIKILSPIAVSPTASPRERQTLALIYALQGDAAMAERIARIDLDPVSAQRALAYYETLRQLAPDARSRAIQSMTTQGKTQRPP